MRFTATLHQIVNISSIALAVAGITALAGCAGETQGPGGTASLHDSSPVQGRDLGRGGATSGGLSSMDQGQNSADYSVYDARQLQAPQPR